jgi:circadian clock protein KaiC
MSPDEEVLAFPGPPERVPSGIAGLDAILGGGLFQGGIYVLAGSPGAGKTVLANQMSFEHVRADGRVLYVTLLSETHGRMLSQMQTMGFFDRALIGDRLNYVSGFNQLESDGLGGLLTLVRRTARDQRATLLVLDGFVTASTFARSEIDYKKFINELQTWVGLVGCTVLLLTSAGATAPEVVIQPEHTMVDGIVTLNTVHFGLRSLRYLRVAKFRGSSYLEGAHNYVISDLGVTVYPRLESAMGRLTILDKDTEITERPPSAISTGLPKLDALLGGGLHRGSNTLVLGSPGAGKTVLGLHFLDTGARAGEPGLLFGFAESPNDVVATAERLEIPLLRHLRAGLVRIAWHPPAERVLDALGAELIELVRRGRIKRLFFDGLGALKQAAAQPRRAGRYIASLLSQLRAHEVATIMSEETRELFVRKVQVPFAGASSAFQNILFIQQAQAKGQLRRLLSIIKTRDGAHDDSFYEFEITNQGISVKEPFRRVAGSGLPAAYRRKMSRWDTGSKPAPGQAPAGRTRKR